jgi:hypothetical protein
MSEEPKEQPKPSKSKQTPSTLSAEDIEAGTMARLCREAVEVVGADAVLVVWTKQRKRKTTICQTALGNGLTVAGLMRWVAEKVEESEESEEEEDEEEDEDED